MSYQGVQLFVPCWVCFCGCLSLSGLLTWWQRDMLDNPAAYTISKTRKANWYGEEGTLIWAPKRLNLLR